MLTNIFIVLSIGLTIINAEEIFRCDFDDENCFQESSTIIVTSQGSSRTAPMSDVTSILETTNLGEKCRLPFRIGDDLCFFCHNGRCLTENNHNGTCQQGKFALIRLVTNNFISYELKIPSGIRNVGQYWLNYYYHMSKEGNKTLRIDKREADGTINSIDTVTNISHNAWIQRQVPFRATTSNYSIFFRFQQTDRFVDSYISIDEISIERNDLHKYEMRSSVTVPIASSTSTTTTSTSSNSAGSTSMMSTSSTNSGASPSTTVSSSSTTGTTRLSTTTMTTTTTTSKTSSLTTTLRTSSSSSSTTSRLNSSTNSTTTIPSTFNLTTIFQNTTFSKIDENKKTVEPYIIVIAVLVPLAFIGLIVLIVWLAKPKVTISPDQDNLTQNTDGYEMNDVHQS